MLQPSPLVILDEPAYGQDRQTMQWVKDIVLKLRQKGTTILLITQDMHTITELADRVLVMANGKLIFDGIPLELFDSPDILEQSSLIRPIVLQLTSVWHETDSTSRGGHASQ